MEAVSTVTPSRVPRALWELRTMIECTIPGSSPYTEFNDYGCWCGFGGSGTPVDGVDKCCRAHDKCYDASANIPHCHSLFSNSYIKSYNYKCEGKNVICESDNNACQMHVCGCDRNLAICLSKAVYHPQYKDMNKKLYCH
ncbi:phospholipase A2, minor isoenzyme-like [Elgaria multicarinata webbii]|uniref:phospholipase A2, minor isoenzyme-like n=1 Tax=Elgaria multicarinata webbii TaxID=159646 RepID=UPI002FCD1F08